MILPENPLLLVDPYENLLQAYRILFEQEGLPVEAVASLEEARDKLSKRSYALILAELLMPGEESLPFWQEIKSSHPEFYLILLTDALIDEERYERIFNAGADDLLFKPFPPGKLLVHIRRGLRLRALLRRQEKQDQLALMDPISWDIEPIILSKDYFKQCFRQALKRARRYKDPLSLLLVKTTGPGNGTKEKAHFLTEVANLLGKITREEDIIGRENGGFGILLYKTDHQGSRVLKIRLSRFMQNHLPFQGEVPHALLKSLKFQSFSIPEQKRIPKPFSQIMKNINREMPFH